MNNTASKKLGRPRDESQDDFVIQKLLEGLPARDIVKMEGAPSKSKVYNLARGFELVKAEVHK